MGALARTHVSQAKRDPLVISIRARGWARQRNPLRESLIRPEARVLHPVGVLTCTHVSLAGRGHSRVTTTPMEG
jgi:hypothetical protein